MSMAPLTRSMKKKARNCKTSSHVSSIQSLPNELLVEILAQVASRSLDDLYMAKLSCKDFNKTSEDDYIFECVDLSKIPLISWTKRERRRSTSKFLKRCRQCGNAEALYREGMRHFFKHSRIQSGIECLKKAASKGHVEASYVYGAILVCCGGDSKQEGLEHLYSLNRHKSKGLSITDCRERIKEFIWSMWVDMNVVTKIIELHNETTGVKTCRNCGNKQDMLTIEGWDFNDHEKFSSCNSCRWHQEVNLFRDILRRSRTWTF